MASKKKTTAMLLNDQSYNLHFARFKCLALDVFEWENLPPLMESRYIEQALFNNGQVVFLQDNELGFLALDGSPINRLNVYGEPTVWNVHGIAFNKIVTDKEDAVVIKNNLVRMPTRMYIENYSRRISEVERTIETNIHNQKFPYIVRVDQKNLLTMKNIYSQAEENEPIIYADKSLDVDSFGVFPTLAPFVADKLTDQKNSLMNEVLTFLGINNANVDKKERLIVDETNANNEFIRKNVEHMLKCRQEACEKINQIFGLNISVKVKEVENGEVHDGTEGDITE